MKSSKRPKLPPGSYGPLRYNFDVKGRSRNRRDFYSLLTPTQRFSLTNLGRYTLRGPSGTQYKIEADYTSKHQWFYIQDRYNSPMNGGPLTSYRYYFSLVAKTDWSESIAAGVYTNLATIHMALLSDDRMALTVANWDYWDDKNLWLRMRKPMPPVMTPPNRRRYKKWRIGVYAEDFRWNYDF